MMDMVMGRKLKGIHVFLMLAGFFGVLFAVNGVFVYFALTSFSGVSVDDAYKKGLSYNQEINRLEEQRARGWQTGFSVSTLPDNHIAVFLSVADKNGQVPENLTATLLISRPARQDQDRTLDLDKADGKFTADLRLPEPGQWDLLVEVKGGGYELPYRVEKRIWVK